MLKKELQNEILKIIGTEGKVLTSEIIRKLNIVKHTINIDLCEMEAQGQLQRVYGGPCPLIQGLFFFQIDEEGRSNKNVWLEKE